MSAFCQATNCSARADLAVRTTQQRGKSAVHTIWNNPEEAPKTAVRYCILCGVEVAAGLAQLSATGETIASVALTREGRAARDEQGVE
jgi:hypothetical protein